MNFNNHYGEGVSDYCLSCEAWITPNEVCLSYLARCNPRPYASSEGVLTSFSATPLSQVMQVWLLGPSANRVKKRRVSCVYHYFLSLAWLCDRAPHPSHRAEPRRIYFGLPSDRVITVSVSSFTLDSSHHLFPSHLGQDILAHQAYSRWLVIWSKRRLIP